MVATPRVTVPHVGRHARSRHIAAAQHQRRQQQEGGGVGDEDERRLAGGDARDALGRLLGPVAERAGLFTKPCSRRPGLAMASRRLAVHEPCRGFGRSAKNPG
jgi:hypothetical protein